MKLDKALTPPGLLHDQHAAFAFDDVTNGIFLAVAESGISASGADPEQLQRVFFGS